MRAAAAAPAAPVGAHARARARIHEHRREPLYIDTPCSVHLIDIPCCSGSTSTLHRALGGARSSFDLGRRPTGHGPQDTGCQQVCSHPAAHLPTVTHVCWPTNSRPVTDSLSVDPHCALRCLPLGACVGASESRCAAAALSTADRPACSRDGYDLLVASNPEALDDPITRARHPLRARVLAVDRGGPRPR